MQAESTERKLNAQKAALAAEEARGSRSPQSALTQLSFLLVFCQLVAMHGSARIVGLFPQTHKVGAKQLSVKQGKPFTQILHVKMKSGGQVGQRCAEVWSRRQGRWERGK
eukprot:1527178-Pleurochrysis_carterae.AAC.1